MPGRTGGASSGGSPSSSSSSHSSSSFSSHSYTRGSSNDSYDSSGGSWATVVVIVGVVIVLLLIMSANDSRSNTSVNVQATTSADIAIMERGILPRLAEWRGQNDGAVHHVHYESAGLPADFNTKEVVYGYCASGQFYVYVLNLDPGFGLAGTADSSGYAYLTEGSPYTCAPTGWQITGNETASAGWYYVNIDTKAATATAGAVLYTATPK